MRVHAAACFMDQQECSRKLTCGCGVCVCVHAHTQCDQDAPLWGNGSWKAGRGYHWAGSALVLRLSVVLLGVLGTAGVADGCG